MYDEEKIKAALSPVFKMEDHQMEAVAKVAAQAQRCARAILNNVPAAEVQKQAIDKVREAFLIAQDCIAKRV